MKETLKKITKRDLQTTANELVSLDNEGKCLLTKPQLTAANRWDKLGTTEFSLRACLSDVLYTVGSRKEAMSYVGRNRMGMDGQHREECCL